MPKATHLTALVLAVTLGSAPALAQSSQSVDEILQTTVVLSEREASLALDLAGGRSLQIRLAGGQVFVAGREVGSYESGGELESAWRQLLRSTADGELEEAWAGFAAGDYADGPASAAIHQALAFLAGGTAGAQAAVPVAPVGELAAGITATPAQEDRPATPAGEVVVGGLIVQLNKADGLDQALARVGLAPQLARALNGDLRVPVRIVLNAEEYRLQEGTTLDATLLLVQSDAVLAGTVAANVIVAEGSLLITPTARLEGDVVAINATVQNRGTIVGTLRDAPQFAPVIAPPVAPSAPIRIQGPSFLSNLWSGLGSLARTIAMYVFFAFLGGVVVYFFRGHLEAVSDTVSYSFGRSFLAGVAAEVLFFPIALVLLVLIVTAIAIPFYILAFAGLSLLGYVAVAHAAGENLTRYRYPSWAARMRRSNSYYYLWNGLGVLLALFAGAAITEVFSPLLGWAHDLLIVAAWILTWVAATSGLGAALLSRAGTQRTFARPRELPGMRVDSYARRPSPGERVRVRRGPRETADD